MCFHSPSCSSNMQIWKSLFTRCCGAKPKSEQRLRYLISSSHAYSRTIAWPSERRGHRSGLEAWREARLSFWQHVTQFFLSFSSLLLLLLHLHLKLLQLVHISFSSLKIVSFLVAKAAKELQCLLLTHFFTRTSCLFNSTVFFLLLCGTECTSPVADKLRLLCLRLCLISFYTIAPCIKACLKAFHTACHVAVCLPFSDEAKTDRQTEREKGGERQQKGGEGQPDTEA